MKLTFSLTALVIGVIAAACCSVAAYSQTPGLPPAPTCPITLSAAIEAREAIERPAPYFVLSLEESQRYGDAARAAYGLEPVEVRERFAIYLDLRRPGYWMLARVMSLPGGPEWLCGPTLDLPEDVHQDAITAALGTAI